MSGVSIHESVTNANSYGVDWQGPHAEEHARNVDVSDVECPLSNENFQQLVALIPDCNAEVSDLGVKMYLDCRNFIKTL